jgi:SHS2 domain-containing protein
MKRYEFVEHTADVAVWAYGGSLKELFQSAALAMFAVLVAKKQNRQEASLKEILIEKEEETLEDLLKGWLDELLYYFSTEHLILHRIKSLEIDENTLKSKVLLDHFDVNFYESKDEIKAVTYHELKVEKIRSRWRAYIIFDV